MKKLIFISFIAFFLLACNTKKTEKNAVITVAEEQYDLHLKAIQDSGKMLIPRTLLKEKIKYVPIDDWTSGFFAGSLWYLYDLTKDKKWEESAINYTEILDSAKYLKWHHDVGFIINASFGNAYENTKNEKYKEVMIEAAKSLATRFRPTPGVIQSWDEDRGWQGKRGWMCPVIIDNMMNLELLFKATQLSNDSSYYKMAVAHADNTLENHFRENWSCYHVIDYDKVKGGVRHKQTAQGYADESSWARGQAWALYGFTMCYHFTKDKRYLDAVDNIYQFIFNNKNLPKDFVPYWDFDAPKIPNEPRDASASAIMASALYELVGYGKTEYKATADKIIASLSTPNYLAEKGTNGFFILKHSVGSIPHGHEIDVPINYADYYFLEALVRKEKLEKN